MKDGSQLDKSEMSSHQVQSQQILNEEMELERVKSVQIPNNDDTVRVFRFNNY